MQDVCKTSRKATFVVVFLLLVLWSVAVPDTSFGLTGGEGDEPNGTAVEIAVPAGGDLATAEDRAGTQLADGGEVAPDTAGRTEAEADAALAVVQRAYGVAGEAGEVTPEAGVEDACPEQTADAAPNETTAESRAADDAGTSALPANETTADGGEEPAVENDASAAVGTDEALSEVSESVQALRSADEATAPELSAASESTYALVACVATGDGDEIVRVQAIDGQDHLVLPSYADLTALSLSWSEAQLGKHVFSALAEKGTYTNKVLDASKASVDAHGAKIVYVRETVNGTTHRVHVLQSGGMRTLYVKSDDPIAHGRAYVDGSDDHSTSATGAMTLVTSEGAVVVQDAKLSQIRGRGNSTWDADKKPYQIKLDKKASLLDGTPENAAKTWVLLANAFDEAGLRNYVALKTGLALGLAETPDAEFVDLYYDGEYRGLYLLTEKVQVNKGRVEIDEIENASSTAVAVDQLPTATAKNAYGYEFQYVKGAVQAKGASTGGFLIELDNGYYASERCYFNTSIGYFVVKSPDDATYAQVKYISECMQAALDVLADPKGNAAAHIDLTSLARCYLVGELSKNPDYLSLSSTYFFKGPGDDVLHMGPLWDFDLAFGTTSFEGYGDYVSPAGLTNTHTLFFTDNRQFIEVAEKELVETFLVQAKGWLGDSSQSSLAPLASLASSIRPALSLDARLWGLVDGHYKSATRHSTTKQATDYLVDWMARRIAWMEDGFTDALEALAARPANDPASTARVERLSGAEALDTMVEIVKKAEFALEKFAVLVTSEGYWDALTAAGLAGMVDAPIIMTPTNALASQAKNLLAELKPTTLIVCGGTAAVSDKVVEAARKVAGAGNVERLWGATAIETALAIYEKAPKITGVDWIDEAYVCTSAGYWDALSVAPLSYATHAPIFLTTGADSLSPAVLSAMQRGGIKTVYIIGGVAAVSEHVEAALRSTSMVVAGRLGGADAVETSDLVARLGIAKGLVENRLGVATINGYWDALSGAAFCGKTRSVIVLVDGTHSATITKFMAEKCARVREAFVFGGERAVSPLTLSVVRRRLSGLA